MKYSIIFSQLASEDLTEILGWYKSREVADLDKQFIAFISKSLKRIEINPELNPIVFKDVRRALLKIFPYKILYYVNEINKEVHVIAVIHISRDPKVWQERVI